MKKLNYLAGLIFVILFINFASAAFLYAGIYIEEEVSSNIGSNFSGIKKIYSSEKKACIMDPMSGLKIIFDFENKKVYSIDDVKKNMSVTDLDKFTFPLNENIYMDFLKLQDNDLYAKESSQSKNIGSYKCTETVIYMPKVAAFARICVSKLDFNIEPLLFFLDKSRDIAIKKILPVLKKKNTYIVDFEISIMRPDSPERFIKNRLVKIEKQDIPDSVFELPKDYTRVNPE